MDGKLTAEQIRVLGCLAEKEMATPEFPRRATNCHLP